MSARSPLATAERLRQANIESAAIIDADPERYGGDFALPVIWARAVLRKEWARQQSVPAFGAAASRRRTERAADRSRPLWSANA